MSSLRVPAYVRPSCEPRFIHLTSSRLSVDIAEPGTVYGGSRFDWSAFITQVTLDGEHTFCAPESVDGTGTGGVGMCAEFGILTAVGYEEAKPGELFTKPGVGLLTRPSQKRYYFQIPHAMSSFERRVEHDGLSAMFVTEPRECNGYALRTTKKVSLCENRLTIDYTAENTGSKRITCDEYNHNFMSLGGRKTGPGLSIRFPYALQPIMPVGRNVVLGEKSLTWAGTLPHAFHRHFPGVPSAPEYWWEMHDEASGLRVREEQDFPWYRFALWATFHVMCPEVFYLLDFGPGERRTWQRKYTFSKE